MITFLIYLVSTLLRVALPCRGLVDDEFEPAIDDPHRKRRQIQTTLSRHATGPDVEAKAVGGALKQAPFDLPACQRRAVVRTGVFNGVHLAVDIEDHDAAAIDEDELALPRCEFVG
jgi:hypothetical protein